MRKQSRENYYPAMKLAGRFISGAKISAGLLILTSGAVALIYGVNPIVQVTHTARKLIVLIWFWNAVVLNICGVMILGAWLIDRYGDRPEER